MNGNRFSVAEENRDRIIRVAAALLKEGGREAVSTRSVSAAAGVQVPSIYRMFGDKQGLLDTVAIHGYLAYLENTSHFEPGVDPVDDLRKGWDLHVDFGLRNPHVYSLIYGQPDPGATSRAVAAAADLIRAIMQRIADAGRLRLSVELAVLLANAAGCGAVLTLIAMPEGERDRTLSDLAREAMITAVTTAQPAVTGSGAIGAAVTLRARLSETSALSAREKGLMQEWLERIAQTRPAEL